MDDIPALARHFLGQSAKFGIAGKPALSEAALAVLTRYHWPGNIRELENVLTRAVILSAGGVIEPHHLHLSSSGSLPQEPNHTEGPRLYHEKMEAYSRKILLEALHRNDWNQTRAAEDLGLQRTYFTKMLRQKNISGRPPRPGSSDSRTNS
jgi:DNA-binding NtrC family response regulator